MADSTPPCDPAPRPAAVASTAASHTLHFAASRDDPASAPASETDPMAYEGHTDHGIMSRLVLFLGAVATVIAVATLGYFLWLEEKKFDVVYARLGMERLPKAIENMPYIKADLIALVPNPCDRANLRRLADSLGDIGQRELATAAQLAFAQHCLKPASASATTPEPILAMLIASAPDSDLRRAAAQVQQSPCNAEAMLSVINALQRNMDHKTASILGESFLGACAQDTSITYWTIVSHNEIGNFRRSLALAEAAERRDPSSPYWPAWKGKNLEKLGRHSEAGDAFLRSLSLWPRPETAHIAEYWNAAMSLRAAGRHCEAADTLAQYISYAPTERRNAQVSSAISENRALGHCP